MSTTIDQRVVEMRFDNKQFESNVSTTMTTIDKLKQKLNFTGAAKGLDNISSAANKVDMSGLNSGVDSVRLNFSALEVFSLTALTRISNAAITAGQKIASALTIDPIKTGFQEYETQMNAVQTILANTQSKGSTLEDVNTALDTLNEYADQTIYNFTEMTRNIGTFTAAGVDLQTSVDSIKGIANLAAVSGSTSQQASTAMYQLSQALAAGKVSLMDWNSVVNAGMGGELFQNALLRTSELLKTGGKEAVNTYGSFRESLTKGQWLTKEVLTETLKQLSGAYTEADLIAQGYTEAQAKEIISLSKTATDAATKVKTFSQLWDVMKESAQSGWAQTWKLIIGDFEEAKALLTPLADFMTGFIGKISDARNALVESALGQGFAEISEKMKAILRPAEQAIDVVKSATNSIKDLDTVVNEVIRGEWGRSDTGRFEKLAEAGYNYCVVQNKVNEALNNGFRYTQEQIDEQDKLIGAQQKTNEEQLKGVDTTSALTESERNLLNGLCRLSDEQLKNLGYTEDQIESFHELKDTADKLGIPLVEFIKYMDDINGRWILINAFKNVGQGIVAVFTAMGEAYREIFPPMTGEQLFDILAGFHKLTTYFKVNADEAVKFKKVFRGVFAALDIALTLISGPLKIAFNIAKEVLGAFNLSFLDVAASIGDAVYNFRNWLDEALDFGAVFEKILPHITNCKEAIKNWIDSLKDSENLPKAIAEGLLRGFGAVYEAAKTVISNLGEYIRNGFTGIPGDVSDGFIGGILDGMKLVGQTMFEFGKMVVQKVRDAIESHSPSMEFFRIGQDVILGFVNGLKDLASKAWDWLKGFGKKCAEVIGDLDLGTVIAAGLSLGMVGALSKIGNALDNLTSPLEGIGDVLESFSKSIDASATLKKSEALRNFAISIAILVGSLAVLTMLNPERIWKAAGLLGLLALGLGAIFIAVDKFGANGVGELKKSINIVALSSFLISLGVALLLIAATMKILGTIDGDEAVNMFTSLAAIIGSIVIVFAAYGKFVKGKSAQNVDKAGKMLKKLATTLLILAIVMKILATMEWSELGKAAVGLTGLALVVGVLIAATSKAGPQADKAGTAIQKIGVAMLLLTIVMKLLAGMEWSELAKGAIGLGALALVVTGLVKATSAAGGNKLDGVGKTLFAMGACMLLLTIVMKLIAGMEWSELAKGAIGVAALGAIVTGLVKATSSAAGGDKLKKVGSTLLMMAIAIGILGGIAAILGLVELDNLVKGITAVGLLSAMVVAMAKATKGAQNVKGNMLMMTIMIGVLAAAAVALSFVPIEKLAKSVSALTILVGALSVLIKSTQSMKSVKMGPLIAMGAIILVLAGVVAALSFIKSETALPNAIALGVLLTALALSMKILSTVGPWVELSIKPAVLMGLVVAELAIILGLLTNSIKNVDAVIPTAVALSVLLLALSAACQLLVPVGAAGPAALIGAGILLVILGVIAAIVYTIGNIMSEIPQEKVEKWKAGLETFLDLLTTLMNGLGEAIGAFVGGIIGGVLESVGESLSTFMDNVQGFITGVSGVKKDVVDGAFNLAAAIVAITAADFIHGLTNLSPFQGSMADLGTDLSDFMRNVQGFLDGVKTIDPSSAEGVKSLSEAILTLTAANFLDGIGRLFGSDASLADFGEQLKTFGPGMAAYARSVAGIDVEAVKGSAEAAKALAEMASALPNSGGLAGFFAGENDLDTFGTKLVSFGSCLKSYGVVVTDIATDAIKASVDAASSLSEMAASIPNMGGLVTFFSGDNDLATFGSQLIVFGNCLRQYSLIVSSLLVEPIEISVSAVSKLAEMAASIPNMGGVVGFFTGDMDLATFGSQLIVFGRSLKDYSIAVADLAIEPILTSVEAAKALARLAEALPSDGGFWSWFKDDTMSMADFGTKIVPLGQGIAAFSAVVANINISALDGAIDAAYRLARFMNNLVGIDVSGTGPFVTAIGTLGTASVNAFINAFSAATDQLNSVGGNMITEVANGMVSRQPALFTLINATMMNVIANMKQFNQNFSAAGMEIIQSLLKGMDGAKPAILVAMSATIASAILSVNKHYASFYSAGAYMVMGFAAGIDANTFIAKAAAVAMAKAALKAAEAALGINSPSREFYKVGDFAGMGFVNALGDYSKQSYDAGSEMADNARKGLSEAIARIGSVVSSDMDMQPTVRPVLDLSNVQNGVGQIDGMFASRSLALAGVNASLSGGVSTNINSIFDRMQKINADRDSKLADKFSELRGDFGSMVNAIGSMGVRIDSGPLVGSIVTKMDGSLGQIASHKGRGN